MQRRVLRPVELNGERIDPRADVARARAAQGRQHQADPGTALIVATARRIDASERTVTRCDVALTVHALLGCALRRARPRNPPVAPRAIRTWAEWIAGLGNPEPAHREHDREM